jgi:CheY-like chemotaxis protein
MVSAPLAIALLGALTSVAITVACVATLRARVARTALRAGEAKHPECVEPNRQTEAGSRVSGDVAHDLNDLLTVITGHTELLIASLDPLGGSIQDAHEIRRAALSAGRLTRTLRTLGGGSGGHRASTDVIDVNAAGLAKVDTSVKQTGGLVQVDSAAGVGTTFTIDLPVTPEAAAGANPALAETRLTAQVLVVEDEPRVRELIKQVLVRAGYDVVAVAGPHAALAALNRQPAISLMLVDVIMPEMDGYDLVAEARKISPGVHVVFVSGFARDTTRHPSGDGFLAKPFTVESLTDIVEETLEGTPSRL